ncbi:MAG: biotin transporter BioY [Nitriliruptoraceae bacterium]
MSAIPAPTAIAPGRVLADLVPGARVRDAGLVAAFAALIGLSAQIAVPLPFTPVPVTGQTFAVLLGAAALGAGRAGLGAALYLALGLAGVPWFTATGGASFGYIVGFVAAAVVIGGLARRGHDRTVLRTAGLMVVGNLVIYAFGVTGLALFLGVGLVPATVLGAVPFLLGDAVKIALAAALLPTAWKLVGSERT